VKFRVEDLSEIEEKLGDAEFVIEKVEEDIYLNHPCRDFGETDEALRIRRDVEGIRVTYKGRKIDPETKTREEIKIEVDDFDKTLKLFEKLSVHFEIAGVAIVLNYLPPMTFLPAAVSYFDFTYKSVPLRPYRHGQPLHPFRCFYQVSVAPILFRIL